MSAKQPPDEIEITPEMLEAGAEAFYEWRGLEYGTGTTAALAIFTAMVSRAPKSRNSRKRRPDLI
jgi:hypothetical protein